MQWTQVLASRSSRMKASEIRELLKLLDQPDILSFAGGIPNPALFPAARIQAGYDAILADPELIYGYEIDVYSERGADRLLVRIKAKEGTDHAALKAFVAGRLTATFGVHTEVKIHPLLDLKSATGGWVSWKTARIMDLRVQQADDIEARSAASLARAVERAI